MEFTGNILEKIHNSIAEARFIIAEVTSPNPDVYYKVGYAHRLGKTVVLPTRDMSSIPFVLKVYNHIVYRNIRELRQSLKKRLAHLQY